MQIAYGNCVKEADEKTWDLWGGQIHNALRGDNVDILQASLAFIAQTSCLIWNLFIRVPYFIDLFFYEYDNNSTMNEKESGFMQPKKKGRKRVHITKRIGRN